MCSCIAQINGPPMRRSYRRTSWRRVKRPRTTSNGITVRSTTGSGASGGASQILSATSARVIGLKQSVDKNAFFDQTMPALMAQMMAQRKGVLIRIRDGLLNKSDDQYPLVQGLADLKEDYYAGTIPGAITGMVKSAGAESQRNAPGRFGGTVEEVCGKPQQFSCWNLKDPNRAQLERVDKANATFAECWTIAELAVDGSLADPTDGADHYHTRGVSPPWSRGKTP